MFEKEIKFISDFNINKIRKLGAFFTLDGLASAKIHPAIYQYISAELDYLFFMDRKRIIKQSVFDYTLPEVTPHFNNISEIIKKQKLLPFEEIKELVVQAVQFNIHFLLKPKWTLSRFIFGEEEEKSSEEVQILLKYLFYYDFYRKIASEYLEKKKILKFRYDEFEPVMNNLTKLLVESQPQAMIDTALNSMADFFNAGDVNKTMIPVAAVEMYLKEKNLVMYISKIRTILSTDMKRKFEVEDFKNAMYSNIAISLDRELREKLNQELAQEYDADALSTISRGKFSFTSTNKFETPAQEVIDYTSAAQKNNTEETISLDDLLDENQIPESASPFIEHQPEQNFQPETEDLGDKSHSGVREFTIKSDAELSKPDMDDRIYTPEDDNDFNTLSITLPEYITQTTESIPPEASDRASEKKEDAAPSLVDVPLTTLEEAEIAKQEPEKVPEAIQEIVTKPEPLPEPKPVQVNKTNDLFSFFSTKETMRIVEEIFNNDSLDFVSTMESIAECSDSEQAKTLLKSVFYTYKINSLTSKEAKLLISKIEEFFRAGN